MTDATATQTGRRRKMGVRPNAEIVAAGWTADRTHNVMILSRPLSDRSLVYSVLIREIDEKKGEITRTEIDRDDSPDAHVLFHALVLPATVKIS